jgi:hypothetical protein
MLAVNAWLFPSRLRASTLPSSRNSWRVIRGSTVEYLPQPDRGGLAACRRFRKGWNDGRSRKLRSPRLSGTTSPPDRGMARPGVGSEQDLGHFFSNRAAWLRILRRGK